MIHHYADLKSVVSKASQNRIESHILQYVDNITGLFFQQVVSLRRILRYLKRLPYRYAAAFFHCNAPKYRIALKLTATEENNL